MTKLSAERKTAKYIRRKSKRNSLPKVQTNSSPFRWLIHTLAWSPLLVLDLFLSSSLWLHTMIYQLTMYGVYVGLFIFCHATGEDSCRVCRIISPSFLLRNDSQAGENSAAVRGDAGAWLRHWRGGDGERERIPVRLRLWWLTILLW